METSSSVKDLTPVLNSYTNNDLAFDLNETTKTQYTILFIIIYLPLYYKYIK